MEIEMPRSVADSESGSQPSPAKWASEIVFFKTLAQKRISITVSAYFPYVLKSTRPGSFIIVYENITSHCCPFHFVGGGHENAGGIGLQSIRRGDSGLGLPVAQ
jgi:hypothetical protein